MSQTIVKEFIEKDGTLINSKMPPTINPMAASNKTTDQHISQSRQGMVWMNYRRFYGEDNEKLPYTAQADKYEKDPEKFYKYLKSIGKGKEFNKYFVKKEEDKTGVQTVLKESGRIKMKDLVEDIIAKKSPIGDIVKKKDNEIANIDQLKEKYPAMLKKVTSLAEGIKDSFSEPEQDVIIDYITQIINS